MDKNTFTGLFLIMLIIAGSVYFMKPSTAELQKERAVQHQDSLKKAGLAVTATASATKTDTAKTPKPIDTAALKSPFGASTVGAEKFVTLENDSVKIKLSTQGGRVYSVELKNYKTFDKKPLILFDGEQNSFGYTFAVGATTVKTSDRYFTPSATELKVTGKDSSSITMRLSYNATQYIDYIYTLKGDGYKLGFVIKPVGLDNVIANSSAINLD